MSSCAKRVCAVFHTSNTPFHTALYFPSTALYSPVISCSAQDYPGCPWRSSRCSLLMP